MQEQNASNSGFLAIVISTNTFTQCEISSSYNDADEDSSLLRRCDLSSSKYLEKFQKITVPLSSSLSTPSTA